MTTITLHVFGKPEWEFNVKRITPQHLIDKGFELQERLCEAAHVLKQLSSHGWTYELTLYDIVFYKDVSVREAKRQCSELGVSEDIVLIDDDAFS